jgi:hypothetical protein
MIIEGFLINDIIPLIKYMEKLRFFIPVFIISLIVVVSVDSYVSSQIVFAKDKITKPSMLNQSSFSIYDGTNRSQEYPDSSILLPLSSKITATDLTSSFSNIIDTQIYTGLDR